MAERLKANIHYPATSEHPICLLDPFAGVGKVHQLATENIQTFGIELEPEWANQHPRTEVGDARDLPFKDGYFDVVVTSPTYGNRMADHHNAAPTCSACKSTGKKLYAGEKNERKCKSCNGTGTSKRISYRHQLGRQLTEGNSGAMQWGYDYRTLHRRAWHEVARVLRPNSLFMLNVSNHIRKEDEQRVAEWHLDYCLTSCGFQLLEIHPIETRRMRFGANGDKRVAHEYLYVMEMPA